MKSAVLFDVRVGEGLRSSSDALRSHHLHAVALGEIVERVVRRDQVAVFRRDISYDLCLESRIQFVIFFR